MVRIINRFHKRIHFTHIRNIRYDTDHSFHEIAYADANGVLDLKKIVEAYYLNGYEGCARPDHGRMI